MSEGERKLTVLFFDVLAEKSLPNQSYWDAIFHVFWVGRYTRDTIKALEHRKKSDFHYIN